MRFPLSHSIVQTDVAGMFINLFLAGDLHKEEARHTERLINTFGKNVSI